MSGSCEVVEGADVGGVVDTTLSPGEGIVEGPFGVVAVWALLL